MSYADSHLRKVFVLKGEVKDAPIADTGDFYVYLDIDRSKLDEALDKICDEVNHFFPNEEDRYKVTLSITIDKEDYWKDGEDTINLF